MACACCGAEPGRFGPGTVHTSRNVTVFIQYNVIPYTVCTVYGAQLWKPTVARSCRLAVLLWYQPHRTIPDSHSGHFSAQFQQYMPSNKQHHHICAHTLGVSCAPTALATIFPPSPTDFEMRPVSPGRCSLAERIPHCSCASWQEVHQQGPSDHRPQRHCRCHPQQHHPL